jgi:hypothetical protein
MAKEDKDAIGGLLDLVGGAIEGLGRLTPAGRASAARTASRQLQNDQARLANALNQLKIIALTDPNNQTANVQANRIFQQMGLPVQEGADFSPFLDKFRAVEIQPTRKEVLERPTPPVGTTVKTKTRAGEEITRKAEPLTASEFSAQLAKKVAAGTDTEQELKALQILQGPKAQTTINLTEPGKTAQEDAKIAIAFQQQAEELNQANPDSPFVFRVKTSAKGQRFLDSEPRKAVSEGTAQTIVQRENLLRLADGIMELYDPKFVGPIEGFIIGGLKEKTGIGLTEREAAFRTKVAKSIKVAYTDSGKQLSDRELARLLEFLPRVSKVDLKFEAEMIEFIDEVETSLAKAKLISKTGRRVAIPDAERRRTSGFVRERFAKQKLDQQDIAVPSDQQRLQEIDRRISELEAQRGK